MVENPWQVDSIQAFSYFKCPECIFDSQEEGIFQEHAIENHPLSLVLFGKTALKEEEFDLIQNPERTLTLSYSHPARYTLIPKNTRSIAVFKAFCGKLLTWNYEILCVPRKYPLSE